MTSRAFAVLTVALALLIAPSTATAETRQGRALDVAEETWGDPCPGSVDVDFEGMPSWVMARAIERRGSGGARLGCRIVLNDEMRWPFAKFCSVVVHEYGHLAGRPHSDDPESVMYRAYREPFAPCRR